MSLPESCSASQQHTKQGRGLLSPAERAIVLSLTLYRLLRTLQCCTMGYPMASSYWISPVGGERVRQGTVWEGTHSHLSACSPRDRVAITEVVTPVNLVIGLLSDTDSEERRRLLLPGASQGCSSVCRVDGALLNNKCNQSGRKRGHSTGVNSFHVQAAALMAQRWGLLGSVLRYPIPL